MLFENANAYSITAETVIRSLKIRLHIYRKAINYCPISASYRLFCILGCCCATVSNDYNRYFIDISSRGSWQQFRNTSK